MNIHDYTHSASGANLYPINDDTIEIIEPFTGNTCWLKRTSWNRYKNLYLQGTNWVAETTPGYTVATQRIGTYATLEEALQCL